MHNVGDKVQSEPQPLSRPGMMRPDLPVGSPERAAYFSALRETFSEDWEAAAEALKCARREGKGDLYFIRAGQAVKIGHTVNIVNRLGKMQADNHEELDCVLLLKGRGHEEPKWHRLFKSLRLRGEWFRMSPELEAAIDLERNAQRVAS